ncbi:ankyrin repeat protein [Megavirus baoshan]|uniref:Ankyrin repeat protein n=1 Tax=Megavirus baoshan TaxID=2496520 RepID=A0A3S8UWP0_9VIRU|nr:ankyrin repeat protein [Megavirus baoshan]AZL89173.1 ankyrin repeat protein [Megavirus baoshan]
MIIELLLPESKDLDVNSEIILKDNDHFNEKFELYHVKNINNTKNKFLANAIYIYIVTVDLMNYETVFEKYSDTFYSNKIYIKEKYNLCDPLTYQLFNLGNIEDNHFIVETCCAQNKLQELDNLFCLNSNIYYDEKCMDNCSEYDDIKILDWWLNSGLELKYSEYAISTASYRGHINVLNWWLNSGLELKYSEQSINCTMFNYTTDILDWWLNSGLELKYTHDIMDNTHNIQILDWWLNSGLELKYTHEAMDHASSVDILEWWLNSGLELKYTINAIELSITKQDIDILNWWLNSGLEIKFDKSRITCQNDTIIINGIVQHNAINIINYCKKMGLIE